MFARTGSHYEIAEVGLRLSCKIPKHLLHISGPMRTSKNSVPLIPLKDFSRMTPAAEKFRQQLQNELGITIGPK